jgi:hypothetical protein
MARQLPRNEWQSYCDRVSKGLEGKRAEIEVAALSLGNQVAAAWLPIIGITYDPKDDIVEVALEGLDHLVQRPRNLAVEEEEGGLASLAITDGEGRSHIVKLKEPLMLPAGTR